MPPREPTPELQLTEQAPHAPQLDITQSAEAAVAVVAVALTVAASDVAVVVVAMVVTAGTAREMSFTP